MGQVSDGCKEADTGRGVVGVRTPAGLSVDKFRLGLSRFAASLEARPRRAPVSPTMQYGGDGQAEVCVPLTRRVPSTSHATSRGDTE